MDVETGTGTGTGQNAPDKIPKSFGQRLKAILLTHLLIILLIGFLIFGIILGLLLRLRSEPYSVRELLYLRFPGELLMNMLKLLILPLIVSSLVSGMTSLDVRASGKLGLRSVVYYLTTTLSAVTLGIIMVMIIQPGRRVDKPTDQEASFRDMKPMDTFMDLIRQMFPSNMVEATFQKTLTVLKEKKPKKTATSSPLPDNATMAPAKPEMVPTLTAVKGMNMLGLVVISIVTGIALNRLGDRGRPLKIAFASITDLTLVLIHAVIWYSPIGVLFLVLEEIVSMDDPKVMFQQLTFYFITVMLGLAVHGFVCLPALFFVICRSNPYKFMNGVLQALVTALGTASSSATMPITMSNLEENNHVDPRVVGFVVPIGATINMDGTALYEAVAVIFISQVEAIELSFGEIIVVCLTATAAAIGAAGVPQAGLVTMVIVLTAVGLPSNRIGMILSVDWLLDRFRTAINVLGDAYGAGIVHHLSWRDLMHMDEEDRLRTLQNQPNPLSVLSHEIEIPESAAAEVPATATAAGSSERAVIPPPQKETDIDNDQLEPLPPTQLP